METKHVSAPEQKNYERAYQLSYQIARDNIVKLKDLEQQSRYSGATYQDADPGQSIIINYLSLPHKITLPGIEISKVASDEEVPLREKLLILHYFISASGIPLSNRPVTFQELPEGVVYATTFAKRTINPLTRFFGEDPDTLLVASDGMGGYKADFGDVAVTINAFPFVPITIVFWRGDDELTPQGNILFDSTITNYIPTEDITVLCETITWKLIRQLKESP